MQQITVSPDEAEQRLDRWLRRRWTHLKQGNIERMCRRGELRVDGARAKPATRVGPGNVIRVPPLPDPVDDAQPSAKPAPIDDSWVRELHDAVIYRDDDLLVLNKPAGLAVQGGTRQKVHLAGMLTCLAFDRDEEPRLVHRLDRDTSGILVLGRTGAAAAALGKMFRGRSVNKIYLAAIAGKPGLPAGRIRYGLIKAGGAGHERMRIVEPDAVGSTPGVQNALTDYRVLEQAGGRMAAVALRPVTGRTHQLRAHMAAIGCPIAGDGKYGSRSQENTGEGWGAGLGGGLSRKLHLHAAALEFDHPRSGRRMFLNAALPEHMRRTWDMMGWSAAVLDKSDVDEVFDGVDIR